jgi:hypothetical protein
MFYAFVNAPSKKSLGVFEYILWQYLTKMYDTSADDIMIFSLINEQNGEFNNIDLKQMNENVLEKVKEQEVILDLS